MKEYSRSQWEHLINEWVVGLRADRNRQIIRDKILGGMTYEQVAEKNNMSLTRVKTVIRTFKHKIEAHEKS